MKKIIKLSIIILIGGIVVMASISMLAVIYKDKLIDFSLSKLNQQLNQKVHVSKVSVSVFNNFPLISVILHQVSIKNNGSEKNLDKTKDLLSLEKVTVKIGILGLLNNKFEVKELVLKNGWIYLFSSSDGRNNFDVFKKSAEGSNDWLLDIGELKIDGVNVKYSDLQKHLEFNADINDSFLKGKMNNDYLLLSYSTKMKVIEFEQGTFFFLKNEPINISGLLYFSPNSFEVESTALLGKSKLEIDGQIGRINNSATKILIVGKEINFERIINLLSQYNISIDENTKIKGKVAFNASISSLNNHNHSFDIQLKFNSNRLIITSLKQPTIFINNLSASFINGKGNQWENSEAIVSFKRIDCGLSSIQGTIKVKNILKPLFYINSSLNLFLLDLKPWGLNFPIEEGSITGNIEVLGRVKTINTSLLSDIEVYNVLGNGELHQLNLSAASNNISLLINSGIFKVSAKELNLLKMNGLLNGSAISASLVISNPLALLTEKERFSVNADIEVDTLNSKWIFDIIDDSSSSESDSKFLLIDKVSHWGGKIKAEKFIYDGFVASSFNSDFSYFDNTLLINKFEGNSCGGTFSGSVSSSKELNGLYKVNSNFTLNKLSISPLFQSFNDFNQSIVTSKNIFGNLSGSVAFTSLLVDNDLINENLNATCSLKVENGRLLNVEQLKGLSRFISLEELEDIRFEQIENSLEIDNGVVSIPTMNLQSSAINLSLEGKHHFNGNFLYNVDLLLSDLLFRKAAQKKPEVSEFGVEQPENIAKKKMFLKIEGNSDDFNISFNRQAAIKSVATNLKNEKQTLKEILNAEFNFLRRKDKGLSANGDSLMLNDSILIKKKQENEQSQKFTIEWDE